MKLRPAMHDEQLAIEAIRAGCEGRAWDERCEALGLQALRLFHAGREGTGREPREGQADLDELAHLLAIRGAVEGYKWSSDTEERLTRILRRWALSRHRRRKGENKRRANRQRREMRAGGSEGGDAAT